MTGGRGALIGVAAALALGAGWLLLVALESAPQDHGAGSGSGGAGERGAAALARGRGSSDTAGGPAHSTSSAALAEARPPAAADLAPREGVEPVAVAPVRDLRGASEDLARAALARSRGEAGTDKLVERARRSGTAGLVDFGRALKDRLLEHPEEATVAIDALVAEDLVDVGFQIARALADAMELPEPRARAVAAIRAAPPERQKVALLALAGRAEPEVVSLAQEIFARGAEGESLEAAATAAFLLGRAYERISEGERERALGRARGVIDSRRVGGRIVEESALILGRSGAPEEDLARLERVLLGTDDPAARAAAVLALLSSGAPPARLRPALEAAIAKDGRPELEAVIRAYLTR